MAWLILKTFRMQLQFPKMSVGVKEDTNRRVLRGSQLIKKGIKLDKICLFFLVDIYSLWFFEQESETCPSMYPKLAKFKLPIYTGPQFF